jgi:hypothetical protein
MRVDEIEKMEFGEIQSRLEEVVAFVENASNKRELAAGYLAIARLHHGTGRLEEAWLAYKEATLHYAECGVEDLVRECEVVAKDLGKRACPPFQDGWDVEVAFDRVARALMGRAKKMVWGDRGRGFLRATALNSRKGGVQGTASQHDFKRGSGTEGLCASSAFQIRTRRCRGCLAFASRRDRLEVGPFSKEPRS